MFSTPLGVVSGSSFCTVLILTDSWRGYSQARCPPRPACAIVDAGFDRAPSFPVPDISRGFLGGGSISGRTWILVEFDVLTKFRI